MVVLLAALILVFVPVIPFELETNASLWCALKTLPCPSS